MTITPTPDPRALIERLTAAATALEADMMERAQHKMDVIHGEQYRIVNAGRTAWSDFTEALAEARLYLSPPPSDASHPVAERGV